MPHLHTEPGGHDLTVSAYVFITKGAEIHLWLHHHKKLNMWMQFGGHVEHTEQPWAAVAHELAEESGYALRQLRVLQPVRFLEPLSNAVLHPADVCVNTHRVGELDHYHTDITYAFITEELPRTKPQDGESDVMKAVTRSELLAIPQGEIPESTREIALYIFDYIMSTWKPVDTSGFFISA